MLWLTAAFAAPPATEAEVDARLIELYAPDSATRLRAADALAQTPPGLVQHLAPAELPCWKGEVDLESPACRYHNHALYHLVRVMDALRWTAGSGSSSPSGAAAETTGFTSPCSSWDRNRPLSAAWCTPAASPCRPSRSTPWWRE